MKEPHVQESELVKNPLIVSLDVDSGQRALELAKALKEKAGGFKIGPRLIIRYGAAFVQELAEMAPVFVDNKYFDIPTIMEAALRATFEAGATLTTVHGLAGFEALERMARVEKELSQKRPFRVLCVTILTSFSKESLPLGLGSKSISDLVHELASMAGEAGLSGIVCSSREVADLKKNHPEFFLVTPGIRFSDEDFGDQKRVMGPAEAVSIGSSALVVGRPIVEAADPIQVAERYLDALRGE